MPLTAHLLKFLVLCLVWGLTWIATKVGIGTVPPLLFAATRFIAAGVLVSLWIWLPLNQPRSLSSARAHPRRRVRPSLPRASVRPAPAHHRPGIAELAGSRRRPARAAPAQPLPDRLAGCRSWPVSR